MSVTLNDDVGLFANQFANSSLDIVLSMCESLIAFYRSVLKNIILYDLYSLQRIVDIIRYVICEFNDIIFYTWELFMI